MPIVWVHGVAVRQDPPYPPETETYLHEIVAPAISDDPANVSIIAANWFPHASTFAWNLRCIPGERSSGITGTGLLGEDAPPAASISAPERLVAAAEAGAVAAPAGDPTGGLLGGPAVNRPRLRDLSPGDLSNFLATILEQPGAADAHADDPTQRAALAVAADRVARDPATRAELLTSQSPDEDMRIVVDRLNAARSLAPGTLGFFDDLRGRIGAALDRAGEAPGFVTTRLAGPHLRDLTTHLSLFTGDLLVYLRARGTPEAPGPIPQTILDALLRAREIQRTRHGEPIVVISHSMGGQILYDLVTSFLPGSRDARLADVRVDFWCAAASQVAYFQEIKTFLVSRPDDGFGAPPGGSITPFPDRRVLGAWWNVWDPNDYLAFTASGIFDEVWDESFDSRLSGLQAHGGYLIRPAFFQRMAERLIEARDQGWHRPADGSAIRGAEPPGAASSPLGGTLTIGGTASGGSASAVDLPGAPFDIGFGAFERASRPIGGDVPSFSIGEDTPSFGEAVGWPGDLLADGGPGGLLGLDGQPPGGLDLSGLAPPTAAAEPPSPPTKHGGFINTEVRDSDTFDLMDRSLVVDKVYTIVFDVDTEARANSGIAGVELADVFDAGETEVELSVQLRSETVRVLSGVQTLVVVPGRRSRNKAKFDIVPKAAGTAILNASFVKAGNLVQVVTLELRVVAREADANQRSLAVGDGEATVVGRTLGSAGTIAPRDLSLIIQPQSGGGAYSLTVAGSVFFQATIPLSARELSDEVNRARQTLLNVVQAKTADGTFPYVGGIQIPDGVHEAALKAVAEAGAALYRRIFRSPDADAQLKLVADTIEGLTSREKLKIQICARDFPVPWGMLYVTRRFDPEQIDPMRFLGLKHVLEVIPLQSTLQAIDALTIATEPLPTISLQFNTDIDAQMGGTFIKDQRAYWQNVRNLTGIDIVERTTASQVMQAMRGGEDGHAVGDALLYFYCHALSRASGGGGADWAFGLSGGDRLPLSRLTLQAPQEDILPGSPLVFINACESAELSPELYDGFVPYFVSKGARGAIGTECKTPALFAEEWARHFFDRFLTGQPIGSIVLDLRREFFEQHHNLLGLLYAVYCDADLVVDPALRIDSR